jgi:UDP-glucose 4-epimerase
MAKAIVTGGAGFIGSHICEELINQGWQVYALDDMSAGKPSNIPRGVCPIIADVSSLKDMRNAFEFSGKVDVVFHNAASKKNVCLNDPMRDLEVNAKGAFNIATICKEKDIRMVHASTGSVYGEAAGRQDELHPINPKSYYGISKFAGERYALMIANATILRYFHVYGERQETNPTLGGVVAIWIDQIKKGEPITIYGDGEQQRSFTYVKDVVKANLKELEGGVYNCASGLNYTLHDLVDELKKIYGNFEVNYKDWQHGDVKFFDVDASKINLEWTTLREGLNLMTRIKKDS